MDPEPGLTRKLDGKTKQLREAGTDIDQARKAWKGAKAIRRDVLSMLSVMAPGICRCMYCGDSEGTNIDHFKPLAMDPYLTFTWINHLLACSNCNSNEKRDLYPCDQEGRSLLIDPTIDDPHEHIRLNFATGCYLPLTPKGDETIKVFGLWRPSLEDGRRNAFIRCKSMLRDSAISRRQGNIERANEVRDSLKVQPFADVLYSMIRRQNDAGSEVVFGSDVIKALQDFSL